MDHQASEKVVWVKHRPYKPLRRTSDLALNLTSFESITQNPRKVPRYTLGKTPHEIVGANLSATAVAATNSTTSSATNKSLNKAPEKTPTGLNTQSSIKQKLVTFTVPDEKLSETTYENVLNAEPPDTKPVNYYARTAVASSVAILFAIASVPLPVTSDRSNHTDFANTIKQNQETDSIAQTNQTGIATAAKSASTSDAQARETIEEFTTATTKELTAEITELKSQNAQLTKQVETLESETLTLNSELLKLELEIYALSPPTDDYNTVAVANNTSYDSAESEFGYVESGVIGQLLTDSDTAIGQVQLADAWTNSENLELAYNQINFGNRSSSAITSEEEFDEWVANNNAEFGLTNQGSFFR